MGSAPDFMPSAPKPAAGVPKDAPLVDAQAVDDLVSSFVRDSPIRKTGESPPRGDDEVPTTEIPTGEPILPPPLDWDALPFTRLVHMIETLGPTL